MCARPDTPVRERERALSPFLCEQEAVCAMCKMLLKLHFLCHVKQCSRDIHSFYIHCRAAARDAINVVVYVCVCGAQQGRERERERESFLVKTCHSCLCVFCEV